MRRRNLFLLAWLCQTPAMWAQGPQPDFPSAEIGNLSVELSNAQTEWVRAGNSLEDEVFHMPMGESRERLRTVLGKMNAYIETRRQFSEAVAAAIEKSRFETPRRRESVTVESVYRDQLQLIGVSLATLQSKLEALRPVPDWARIRRDVQAERTAVMALQSSRREALPADVPLPKLVPSAMMSAAAYRQADSELRDALQRLWSRYYKSLLEVVDQGTRGAPAMPARSAVKTAAAKASTPQSPLSGAWTYVEGSQQFNGVGEPRHVILELWMDGGDLLGRYRATLQDFRGEHVLDLKLRGKLAGAGREQTLEFDAGEPGGAGRIVLEGPHASGMELTLTRVVSVDGSVPRGRETLRRR